MNFVDMTKRELEDYGRTVGIELDRRLTKSVLIERLSDHLSSSEENLDPIYVDAELEEEWGQADIEHPLMPVDAFVAPIAEEIFVDPIQAIQAEKDARRGVHNQSEMVRQAEEKYQILRDKRINAEVLELKAHTEVEVARKNLSSVQKAWEDSKELL
jgi:hypothetical protein